MMKWHTRSRTSQPVQPDLIQRRLFTVHFHIYAAKTYIDRHGAPGSLEEIASHRIVTFGEPVPAYLRDVNWLQGQVATGGAGVDGPHVLQINDLRSIRRAMAAGAGIAALPDYLIQDETDMVRLLPETDMPSFDTFFCYPEAIKNTAKLKAFRDFLLTKARQWRY